MSIGLVIFIPSEFIIIKNIEKRDIAVFNTTKAIIKDNLYWLFKYSKKIEQISYLDSQLYELKQLILKTEINNSYNIIITDLENEIKTTNISSKNIANDNKSKQIINQYQNNNQNNKYDKIARINIKGGINNHGIRDYVGYAYFKYSSQKVKEINQEIKNIRIYTYSLFFLIIILSFWGVSKFLKKYTLKEIIKQGENQIIEFKPSFFTDESIPGNRNFEHDCAKVISSFFNTNGGYLFIGVSDDGEIQGLDRDFEYIRNRRSLNREDLIDPNKSYHDEYIRRIKGCLGRIINKEAVSILKLDIKQINNREILVIRCPPTKNLVVTKLNNNKWAIYFRQGSETIVYQVIEGSPNKNRMLSLWENIVTNFLGYNNTSRSLVWQFKNLFKQI